MFPLIKPLIVSFVLVIIATICHVAKPWVITSGLALKYYLNAKNAIRSGFDFNRSGYGASPHGASQYDSDKKINQYCVGFQHTFMDLKKLKVYMFTDLNYQSFQVSGSTTYSNLNTRPGYTEGSYDSVMFLSQKVHAFNLMLGAGIRLVEYKRIFFSVESAIGLSYYTGTQETNGSVSASYSNPYTPSTGSQQNAGQSLIIYHQIPSVSTMTTHTKLNGSMIRLVFGIVF